MTRSLAASCAWLFVALLAAGCGAGDDGGGDAAGGGGEGSFDLCPDPDNGHVDYASADPNACQSIELACAADQFGFDNACGCGCIDKGEPICPPIDDPSVSWISMDPAECPLEPPMCEGGRSGFSGSCGCGCAAPGA